MTSLTLPCALATTPDVPGSGGDGDTGDVGGGRPPKVASPPLPLLAAFVSSCLCGPSSFVHCPLLFGAISIVQLPELGLLVSLLFTDSFSTLLFLGLGPITSESYPPTFHLAQLELSYLPLTFGMPLPRLCCSPSTLPFTLCTLIGCP